MRRLRHAQPSLWEGFLAEEVAELWEPWMREVDALLEDDDLLSAVVEAQGQRHKQSCRLGRHQTPAEVVLRMLLLLVDQTQGADQIQDLWHGSLASGDKFDCSSSHSS
jgi:hypothetical protein